MNPEEELNAAQAAMPDAELIERIREALPRWREGRGWRMRVPEQVDDSDMLIGELLRRFERLAQPVCRPRRIAWAGGEIEKGVCLDCGAKLDGVCRKKT